MRAKVVLLDETFISAMVDPGSVWHATSRASYQRLVEAFARKEILLVASDDALDGPIVELRRTLLAPVARLRVSKRQRRAAANVQRGYGPTMALTLVLAREERVDLVATFDRQIAELKIATVVHPTLVESSSEPTKVSETELND